MTALVNAGMAGRKFVPNVGPQTDGYFSEADELFYGGQAGGGKSSLAVGLSYEEHLRSLILRRYNKDAKKLGRAELIGRLLDGDSTGWNGSDLIYTDDKRLIEFGGCEYEDDKERRKGDPYDLYVFDEVADFLQSQYEFIIGWNRSAVKGQRCRVLATGNPPTSAEGLWIIDYWGAWLDPAHPNPAEEGELRWYVRNELDESIEVDGRGPHLVDGEMVEARSRTFIRAKLSDNPYLYDDGEYKRTLDGLPVEIRKAYRDGHFESSLKDHPFQMIPTSWVLEAQERWTPRPPEGIPMTAIGVDCTGGGADENKISCRHGEWFAELVTIPGKETPMGKDLVGPIIANRRDKAEVIIDCGGGYGGSAYKTLLENEVKVHAYKGSEGTTKRTVDAQMPFNHTRTAAYWGLREALDPGQPGGSLIALPPCKRLLSDLTAVNFEEKTGKICAEPKKDLMKRIGRSPGDGDAVAMAWWKGMKQSNVQGGWGQLNSQPEIKLGRSSPLSAGTRR